MILVGSRKDSETYVRNKERACKEVGIESYASNLPDTISQEELIEVGIVVINALSARLDTGGERVQ